MQRPRRGPAAAGRGGATSTATPRRRRVAVAPVAAALALALVLGQGLVLAGLLLAGGPGAAAEAPVLAPLADPPAPLAAAAPRAPAPSPESEAGSAAAGKAKKLDACAIVAVYAGKTCKVKKDGKVLVVKDPTVIVQKPVVDGEDTFLSPNRFAKQYAARYPSSAAGPTANVTFTGQPVVAAELDGVRFQKPASGNAKLKFKVAPRGRKGYQFALAAVDPATDQCEIQFLTPCESTACTYADKKCAAGAVCPGGTAVSAECADPAGKGNPCACTALQQLAGMSDELRAEAPWNDLANQKYCGAERDFDDYKDGSLNVLCESVDGVLLPSFVNGELSGLAGALPRSLGDLGPSMTYLVAGSNLITSVPTEIGMLTALGGLMVSPCWQHDAAMRRTDSLEAREQHPGHDPDRDRRPQALDGVTALRELSDRSAGVDRRPRLDGARPWLQPAHGRPDRVPDLGSGVRLLPRRKSSRRRRHVQLRQRRPRHHLLHRRQLRRHLMVHLVVL